MIEILKDICVWLVILSITYGIATTANGDLFFWGAIGAVIASAITR